MHRPNPAEDEKMRQIVELHGFSLNPDSELMKYCKQREEEALRDFPAKLEQFVRDNP